MLEYTFVEDVAAALINTSGLFLFLKFCFEVLKCLPFLLYLCVPDCVEPLRIVRMCEK